MGGWKKKVEECEKGGGGSEMIIRFHENAEEEVGEVGGEVRGRKSPTKSSCIYVVKNKERLGSEQNSAALFPSNFPHNQSSHATNVSDIRRDTAIHPLPFRSI
jgi:hypothetical protein